MKKEIAVISNLKKKCTSNRIIFLVLFILSSGFGLFADGTLFVGLEGSAPPTFQSDLSGFPNVIWTNNFSFDVSGAAATPEGIIYLCNGAFTTHLYEATLTSPPQQICIISEDMSSLAYARGTLYGFSNYADPKGIYSIDTATGEATLVMDVYSQNGFRFFALDYNPLDSLFYGYTEYGTSGLYSINIDTQEMIQIAGTIPASNAQGRGLAVGDNSVFLTATRGDDGISYFAYDLSQGAGGNWTEFTNPYPNYHSTGGAAWIPAPAQNVPLHGNVEGSDEPGVGLANCDVILSGNNTYQTQTDQNGYFEIGEVAANLEYSLEISHAGYQTYNTVLEVGSVEMNLGTISLDEIAYPVNNVLAVINSENTEVLITWNAPTQDFRDLESYKIYRFLAIDSNSPALWEIINEAVTDTFFTDTNWTSLEPDFYQYAVSAVYTNGIESEAVLSNEVEKLPVEADNNFLPKNNILSNFPNPFNFSTTISYEFSTEQNEQKTILIYNIKGQKVKTFSNFQINKSSNQQIQWDGTDENNKRVKSGIYLYRLKIGNKNSSVQKMILLK